MSLAPDTESTAKPEDLSGKEKLGFILFVIVFNAVLILVIQCVASLFGLSIL